MAWDPNVANRVYLGNDGGIYHSDGNGSNSTWVHATYEPFNQGYHLAVAADDPNRIAVGLQDNGSNRTWTNGSSTPTPPFTFNSLRRRRRPLRRHRPVEPQLLLPVLAGRRVRRAARHRRRRAARSAARRSTACAGRPTHRSCSTRTTRRSSTSAGEVIDRSTNHCQGGFTQISPSSRLQPRSPDDLPGPIPPEEQDTGLYANLYGAVTAIGVAKDALPGSTAPNNYAQTIYAGTDTGLLWKTSDAGAHWTKLTRNGLPTRWVNGIAVDPADPDHAYVIFSGYREGDNAANIWETTNGGTFWTNISGNLPNAPLDARRVRQRPTAS